MAESSEDSYTNDQPHFSDDSLSEYSEDSYTNDQPHFSDDLFDESSVEGFNYHYNSDIVHQSLLPDDTFVDKVQSGPSLHNSQ